MTENSTIEKIAKSKWLGYFLIFWGATFLVRAIADFEYYLFNFGGETVLETATWIVYDVVSIGAAIALWMVAAKIVLAKQQ